MTTDNTSNEVVAEESRGGTKITSLVMVVLIVVAGALLLVRAVRDARESARCLQCQGHLKQIALALHNYNEANGCFPPAYIADENGKPMHSWRVLIMPFMDGYDSFKQYRFDEPWNSLHNLAIAKKEPLFSVYFRCPSHPEPDRPYTHYVIIVGQHGISDGPSSRGFNEITDGSSDTLLVVEIVDSDILWTEPRDLRFDEMDFNINGNKNPGIGSYHRKKAFVALCDGSVRALSESTPPDVVKALATIDGGEEVELPRE